MVGTLSSRLSSRSRFDCSTFLEGFVSTTFFGVFVSTFFGVFVSTFFGVFVETFFTSSSDSEDDSDESSEELSSLLSSDSDSFFDVGIFAAASSDFSSVFFDSS